VCARICHNHIAFSFNIIRGDGGGEAQSAKDQRAGGLSLQLFHDFPSRIPAGLWNDRFSVFAPRGTWPARKTSARSPLCCNVRKINNHRHRIFNTHSFFSDFLVQ